MSLMMDGRMKRYYVLFNSISVKSGGWEDDYERLCAMKTRVRSKGFLPAAGLEPGTIDQQANA